MKEFKKVLLRVFVGAEIVLITFFYLCGSGGLRALQKASICNNELLEDIRVLETENNALVRELDERKNNRYKESIARKELQMAYDNETIYLLDKG